MNFGISTGALMQPTNQGFHGQWSENAENASTVAWVEPLLEKLSTGDHSAFWPLWEQYQDYLYHRCCSWMGGNRSQAQDALSEIMLKAWEKLPQFAAKITNLKGWLTKFAHNFCIDCHRDNSSGAIGVENLEAIAVKEGNGLVTEFDTPGKLVENRELLEVIRSALEDLPQNQRDVCILHFEQELSYQEIAQKLDISNNTVRKRIQRAREKLQQLLQTYLAGLDHKAYGDIALLKEIKRISEQETREKKDIESHVTPADMEMEKEDLETTKQSESLREIEISEDGDIFNKGNYPEIRLETTAEEITSLVEPELAALLNLLLNNSRVGILPARNKHETGKMPVPPRCPFHKDPERARCPFHKTLKIIPLLSNVIKRFSNLPSTKLSDSNACPMDWVKPRSLKALVIFPPSLGNKSQEVSIWQDLAQFPSVVRLLSEWGTLTKKVEPSSNQKLYTGDRGPPEY